MVAVMGGLIESWVAVFEVWGVVWFVLVIGERGRGGAGGGTYVCFEVTLQSRGTVMFSSLRMAIASVGDDVCVCSQVICGIVVW